METRNIKLTLEKAREFYYKSGEFRDLILSAFSEEELLDKKLPKTWEEFCKNNPVSDEEAYIEHDSRIFTTSFLPRDSVIDKNTLPSYEAAEAHRALMQLHQLRDCYRQGWVPDWSIEGFKCCILKSGTDIKVEIGFTHNHFLSFQTYELAQQFLNNFRYLIEEAGDLI